MSTKIKEPKEKVLLDSKVDKSEQSTLDELMLKKISAKEDKWNKQQEEQTKLLKGLFNFTNPKLINQVLWIKNIHPSIIKQNDKEEFETDLYNKQIFLFEVLNRKENKWEPKRAIFPTYMHTRITNLDYTPQDIFSVKYQGLKPNSNDPEQSYHKFYIEKLE